MKISLVIATRNRREKLERCLAAVARLEYHDPWEVVVCDNGSTDDTAAWLLRFAAEAPFPLVLVSAPIQGKGRALNLALTGASGDVVAFTDDDCYPAPDYLQELAEAFRDPGLAYLGGRILLFDPDDYPITVRTSTRPEWLPPYKPVIAGTVQGANMAFRRTALDRLGGFDPLLGPGTPFVIEDADLVARAAAAGMAGGYFPGPVVYHHHGRKAPDDVTALTHVYDRGRGAMFAKMLLDRRTRLPYFKQWYWQLQWRQAPRIMREFWGAALYCVARARRGPPSEPRRAPVAAVNGNGRVKRSGAKL